MRVCGGELRGRTVTVPRGTVRPTQERVREALFSMLADRVPGSRFLDLCAGSGAVGIEAWSRGAGGVHWVESDRRVAAVLRKNVDDLCGGGTVTIARAEGFLKTCASVFDIVFCDPPYAHEGDVASLPTRILETIGERNLLADGGVVVIEQRESSAVALPAGWEPVVDRRYGDTRLLIVRRTP